MISRGRLGALVALSMIGAVSASSSMRLQPEPVDPEPEIDTRPQNGKGRRSSPPKLRRYGGSPKLDHATEADARTDEDARRIAAAIAKRARRARKSEKA